MRNEYAGICGITMEELTTQMSADVDRLAERLGKTREETLAKLVEYYDGYRFAAESPDVFNPFSLLNAMAAGELDYYWFSSGTPTYLIEMLRKFHVMPSQIGGGDADKSEFDAPTESMTSVIPLLYQSGYITIKGYDPETDLYTLDIPNKEIRVGLYRCLLPGYIGTNTVTGTTTIAQDVGPDTPWQHGRGTGHAPGIPRDRALLPGSQHGGPLPADDVRHILHPQPLRRRGGAHAARPR